MKSGFTILIFLLFIFSQESHSQWKYSSTNVESTQYTWAIAVIGEDMFAGLFDGGVYKSTDNGKSWAAANKGIEYEDVDYLAANGSNLYAAIYAKGVWTSNDKGASWRQISNGLLNKYVNAITVSNNVLFAGTRDGGIYVSKDNGANWTVANTGLSSLNINCMTSGGGYVYAGTASGMFVSANGGTSWSPANTGLTETDIQTLTVSGAKVYAGTRYHVWCSSNAGANWSPIGETSNRVTAILSRNNYVFVSVYGSGGIYLTSDNGTNWSNVGSDMLEKNVLCMAMNSSTIFAGEPSIFVYYRALNEMIPVTSVNEAVRPMEFSLLQNYPNPFNPSTTITYSIKNEGLVKLSVYNLLGKEVAELVNEWKPAGIYSLNFRAAGDLPSGIYLYRLQSGGFTETRKFTLLK